MKSNQMLIAAVVFILLSVACMYMTRGGGGGGSGGGNGKGVTIVTEMPQWGYSLDNDGFADDGIPMGLPETLGTDAPMESLPDTLPPLPEIDVPEPGLMGIMGGPTTVEPTTMGPIADGAEEFTQYAPRRFKGDIL